MFALCVQTYPPDDGEMSISSMVSSCFPAVSVVIISNRSLPFSTGTSISYKPSGDGLVDFSPMLINDVSGPTDPRMVMTDSIISGGVQSNKMLISLLW